MTRPARPGDICIIIAPLVGGGRNLGKQVTCVKQCSCSPNNWACVALEPVWLYALGGDLHLCPAGTDFCLPKSHIIPLADPDRSATPDPIALPTHHPEPTSC